MLAMVESRLARDQAFGRLATQALLCRAGLRMLATAPRGEVERIIREQLQVELAARYPVVLGDDPGGGDGGSDGELKQGAA